MSGAKCGIGREVAHRSNVAEMIPRISLTLNPGYVPARKYAAASCPAMRPNTNARRTETAFGAVP